MRMTIISHFVWQFKLWWTCVALVGLLYVCGAAVWMATNKLLFSPSKIEIEISAFETKSMKVFTYFKFGWLVYWVVKSLGTYVIGNMSAMRKAGNSEQMIGLLSLSSISLTRNAKHNIVMYFSPQSLKSAESAKKFCTSQGWLLIDIILVCKWLTSFNADI